MANVTYYLGAGASANCLPVINNMRSRILTMSKYVKKFDPVHFNDDAINAGMSYHPQFSDTGREIQQLLDWLYDVSAYHQTVDTLAKKYFHTDPTALQKLKTSLIIYFTLEQILKDHLSQVGDDYQRGLQKEAPDLRYDSFIASLLKNTPDKIELMDNVRIISWNYDMQFELSFKNYCKDEAIFYIQRALNILPSRAMVTHKDWINDIPRDKFSFVKLNGQAIFDRVDTENHYQSIFDLTGATDLEKLQEFFKLYQSWSKNDEAKKHVHQHFNYCWERSEHFNDKYAQINDVLHTAELIAEQTEVLVVIGYSFPFFNREVDRNLINRMQRLRKIYVQDIVPENSISILKSSFQSLIEKEGFNYFFEPVTNVNAFFLPPDL